MKKTFVIGHRHPDTDSICSAIAYAELKNKLGKGRYEPRRAGEINDETNFVLKYFDIRKPRLIEDVNTQVSDIEIRKIAGVSGDITVKRAWDIMMDKSIATLPVINDNKELLGLITIGAIARAYMNIEDSRVLAIANTKYANILETINGQMLVGNEDEVFNKGKIIVAASELDKIEEHIAGHDLIIVGNRYDAQLCAIKKGVECIVLCLGAELDEKLAKLAKDLSVVVIRTDYDAFTVSRLISQSMPISYFMEARSIISFEEDDYIEDIKETMATVRYRYFPVLDKRGRYKGMISRRNLLGASGKNVILVDHNEKSQAVRGIERANVLEIIDHHRISTIKTTSPLYFRAQALGCTATIIYQIYKEEGVEIEPKIAGLMCSAIISDTLLFKSPTCTALDEKVARDLANIAGIDIEKYAHDMFAAASNVRKKKDAQIVGQDYKQFSISNKKIAIGQLSLLDKDEINYLVDRLPAYLEKLRKRTNEDIIYFMLTNILEESTTLLCIGKGAASLAISAFGLERKYGVDSSSVAIEIRGLVSRKKQLVPALTMV